MTATVAKPNMTFKPAPKGGSMLVVDDFNFSGAVLSAELQHVSVAKAAADLLAPPAADTAAVAPAAAAPEPGAGPTVTLTPELAAQPSGAIVAWWLPTEPAAALWSCVPVGIDAEEPDDLHVTIAYLGDVSELDEATRLTILNAIEMVTAYWAPLAGTVGGLGVFPANGETKPFYASVDVPGLSGLREAIVGALGEYGVTVPAEHGFVPHITLAYLPADAAMPEDTDRLNGQIPVTIDRITVAIGGQQHSYPLTGTFVSKDASGALSTSDLATDGGLKNPTQGQKPKSPKRSPQMWAKRDPSPTTRLVAKGLPAPLPAEAFPSSSLDANWPVDDALLALQWVYTQVAWARNNVQEVDPISWFEHMQEVIGYYLTYYQERARAASDGVAKSADLTGAPPQWAQREAVRLFHEHAINPEAYAPTLVARTRRGRLLRVDGPGVFGYVLLPVSRSGPGHAAVLATVSLDAGSYWVDAQLLPDITVERAAELDGEPAKWDAELRAALTALPKPGRYRIFRSAEERRYTLGVAYPANALDSHGDFTTPDELEAAAWHYLKSAGGAGLMHRKGTDGAGEVVESYIYRGPDWPIADQIVKAGDWLLGVIWGEPAWAEIKAGNLTGYSFQGLATRDDVPAPAPAAAAAVAGA